MAQKVLMAGDTHGNYGEWKYNLVPRALTTGAKVVLQLGDFGFWPQTRKGAVYLCDLDRLLKKHDLQVIFVDGNHEDHKMLAKVPRRADGLGEVGERILWLPRGHRLELEGVKFLGLGGAWSIDRKFRVLDSGHYGWFPEEVITREQVDQAIAGGPCDILLAHDAPRSATYKIIPLTDYGFTFPFPDADDNARLLEEVALATTPKQIWHGHWHQFMDQNIDLGQPFSQSSIPIRVIGLNCDGRPMACAALELPSLAVEYPDLTRGIQ